MLEDAPCAFLAHRRSFVAHRSDLEGVTLHLLSPSVTPKDLWFAKGADKTQPPASDSVPALTVTGPTKPPPVRLSVPVPNLVSEAPAAVGVRAGVQITVLAP